MIENRDSLEFLQSRKDCEFDINYSDAPYNLGSEVCILPNGKLDYKRKGDFMGKWESLGGEWWEKWFEESFRTLKHGGYCLMFSIDRQTLLFEYYALKAGFQVNKQKIYWYFISSFPKSTDLSKNLDMYFGEERTEIIGKKEGNWGNNNRVNDDNWKDKSVNGFLDITAPSHQLAQKYNGYKYGIAPLKQMCEVVLVFQKPYKTGSCLHDTLRYENGDNECCCGALDIDNNRVGNTEIKTCGGDKNGKNVPIFPKDFAESFHNGRFPTQMFCDSETAKVLDMQSGLQKGDKRDFVKVHKREGEIFNGLKGGILTPTHKDDGGCSKSLHICDYENNEMDLFMYSPKVQAKEREKGTEGENNHVTLKPIKLNERILRLFKTPNPQKIVYPFAGVNSEVIGGFRAGFTDFCGCEINSKYCEIGRKRFEYFTLQKTENIEQREEKENTQTTLF